jgi:hypothetical protein
VVDVFFVTTYAKEKGLTMSEEDKVVRRIFGRERSYNTRMETITY